MNKKKLITCIIVFCFVVGFAGTFGALAAEKRKIEMQSSMFGGVLYQLCFAFSEIVKKHSQIIELNPVESAGTGAGIMKVYGDPKDRITAGTPITCIAAKHGQKPFNKPYPDMRIMGNFVRNVQVLITLDPDIKQVTDLKGKKVGLGPQPTVLGRSMRDVIEVGYGLKGQLKIFHMKWPQLKDSLLDGSIDAMVLGVSSRPAGKWVAVPVYQEILAAGKTPHYMGYTKEILENTGKATNSNLPPLVLPKDSVASGQPDRDIQAFIDDLGVWAHKDFDLALAYELTRILHEHYDEMKTITGVAKATHKDIIFDLAVTDDMIHPGSMKYLKEKGLR